MGAQGSTAVPWGCPWGHARAGGCARQGPRPDVLLAGTRVADLQGAKPFRCKGGDPCVCGSLFYFTAAPCLAPAWLLLPPPCAMPWVIPGCQPRSRAEREAVPHVSFASLSTGQPAGYTEGLLLCSGGGG